jgi:hypothetical protein
MAVTTIPKNKKGYQFNDNLSPEDESRDSN